MRKNFGTKPILYPQPVFIIGAVNTNLYCHLGAPYNTETAVFWYLDF